jgi:hypothetical protein
MEKNTITCPKCGEGNPFFNTVCSECKTYLRDRIYNIDLFSTSTSLIDNPSGAFCTIVFAEHKNFIIFLLVLIGLKQLINARFLSLITVGEFDSTIGLLISYLIVLTIVSGFFILYSFALREIAKLSGLEIRAKDTFAVIVYSQTPLVFAFIILFPLELIIFGDYLFSLNPSPFVIKEMPAYVFLVVECLAILWSIFLSYWAFYIISKDKIFSITNTIAFNLILIIILNLTSIFIFRV